MKQQQKDMKNSSITSCSNKSDDLFQLQKKKMFYFRTHSRRKEKGTPNMSHFFLSRTHTHTHTFFASVSCFLTSPGQALSFILLHVYFFLCLFKTKIDCCKSIKIFYFKWKSHFSLQFLRTPKINGISILLDKRENQHCTLIWAFN